MCLVREIVRLMMSSSKIVVLSTFYRSHTLSAQYLHTYQHTDIIIVTGHLSSLDWSMSSNSPPPSIVGIGDGPPPAPPDSAFLDLESTMFVMPGSDDLDILDLSVAMECNDENNDINVDPDNLTGLLDETQVRSEVYRSEVYRSEGLTTCQDNMKTMFTMINRRGVAMCMVGSCDVHGGVTTQDAPEFHCRYLPQYATRRCPLFVASFSHFTL